MTEESTLSNNKTFCACGCGYRVTGFNHNTKQRHRFRRGHNIKQHGNPMWRGGRFIDKHGYVWVQAKWHPRADKKGYVPEHILVLEHVIGRYLVKGEEVHHLNKIRDDNRQENLKLMASKSEHLREHNPQMDMSNRKCFDCNRGLQEVGRNWHQDIFDNNKLRCSNCYQKEKRKMKKML